MAQQRLWGKSSADLAHLDFGYKYPNGLQLKPGTLFHNKIRDMVMERAWKSYNHNPSRRDDWAEVDNMMTGYIYQDEDELQEVAKDPRKPISIVVPMMYTVLETLMTYWTAAFLQPPYFRLGGVGPEDILGSILLELDVDRQMIRSKAALPLYIMHKDALTYGYGIAAPTWEVKTEEREVTKSIQQSGFLGWKMAPTLRSEIEHTIIYEGNKIENIDPYKFLPDPNFPIHKIQDSEYVGWVSSSNRIALMRQEGNNDNVFNVKYLSRIDGRSCIGSTDESGRHDYMGGEDTVSQDDIVNRVDLIHMYIDLIPAEHNLSKKESPEKWQFTVAGDEIVIRCKPAKLQHGMFPVAVDAPDFDGYSTRPISRLETLYGLQVGLNWMINTHVENVRKAVNDMIVVDPDMINVADLEDPRPGKIIRTTRNAWGKGGLRDYIMQLNVNDITKDNINDAFYFADMMSRISAASDSVQGLIKSRGERVSAAEARDSRLSALSRLERSAKISSIMAMYDLGYMIASHTQQFRSIEEYVNITGRWEEVLRQEYGYSGDRALIRPQDLNVRYDIDVKDGSVSGGEFAQEWVQLYQIMSQNPAIAQSFDMVRVFKHIARIMGAKDINDFVIKNPINIQAGTPEDMMRAQDSGATPFNLGGA